MKAAKIRSSSSGTPDLIVAYEFKSFDEFTVLLSRLKTDAPTYSSYLRVHAPVDNKSVEGPYTRLVYLMPDNRSPVEIVRNYQEEIVAGGGTVLYECKREECGGDENRGIANTNSGSMSLAMYLRPYDRLGLERFSEGYCATTSPIMDQRYLVAELANSSALVSVHTYTLKDRTDWSNCDAFNGRAVAVVDLVEGQKREQNMIQVQAGEMAKQISTTGSVSIYGVYFDSNEATVKPESNEALLEISKLTAEQPDLRLLVVGHTDNSGTFEYNLELSQRRAAAVVDALVSKHQVRKDRLTPFGVAYASPVSSNGTEDGRALNRRVELVENNGD